MLNRIFASFKYIDKNEGREFSIKIIVNNFYPYFWFFLEFFLFYPYKKIKPKIRIKSPKDR